MVELNSLQVDASQWYFIVNPAHRKKTANFLWWKLTESTVFLHHWLPVWSNLPAAMDAVWTRRASKNKQGCFFIVACVLLLLGRNTRQLCTWCELTQWLQRILNELVVSWLKMKPQGNVAFGVRFDVFVLGIGTELARCYVNDLKLRTFRHIYYELGHSLCFLAPCSTSSWWGEVCN